jgi:hypothetical protein
MFKEQCAKDWTHGLEEIRHAVIEHIEFNQPIRIDDSVIKEIRQDEAIPVFLPASLIAAIIFLQITRNEKENDHCQSLEIPIIEVFLRLRQVAEYYAAHCQCLSPIYPYQSLFHTAKIRISEQKSKFI